MGDWPSPPIVDDSAPGYISSSKAFGNTQMSGTGASTAWPTTNKALFVPFRVANPVVVYKMVIGSGATATGNFDTGIYNAWGVRLVSSGATAKGSNVETIIDITDTLLGPGLYYFALAADGTNNYSLVTLSGSSPVPAQKARLLGMLEMASAYTLPANATFAAASTGLIPCIAAYFYPY